MGWTFFQHNTELAMIISSPSSPKSTLGFGGLFVHLFVLQYITVDI